MPDPTPPSPDPQAAPEATDRAAMPSRAWPGRVLGAAGFVFVPFVGSGIAQAARQNWRDLTLLEKVAPTGTMRAIVHNFRAAIALVATPSDPQTTQYARKAAALLQIALTLTLVIGGGVLLGTFLVNHIFSQGSLLVSSMIHSVISSAFAQTVQSGLSFAPDAWTERLWAEVKEIGSGEGALTVLLGVVNLFFCFVFALLLLAKGLVIPADTAGSGRMAISKYWIVRVAVALFLIYPGTTPGINGGQTMILKLAQWGGALGARGWDMFIQNRIDEDQPFVLPPLPDEFQAVISHLILDETCMYLANVVAQRENDPPYVAFIPPARMPSRTAYIVTASYDGVGPGLPKNVCGRYTLRIEDHGSAAEQAALRAHINALNAILPKAHDLARTIGDHFLPGTGSYAQPLPDVDELLDASGIYDLYTRQLARDLAKTQPLAERERAKTVTAHIKRDGWMAAGAWAMRLAQRGQNFTTAYQAFPTVTPPLPAAHGISDILATALPKTADWLANSRHPTHAKGLTLQGKGALIDQLKQGSMDPEHLIVFDFLTPDLSSDPLDSLVSYGQSILNWWWGSFITLSGVFTAAGATKAIPLIGDGVYGALSAGWSVIGPFFTGLMTLLAVAGAVLGYLLPFLPYALFIMGIALWMQAGLIALLGVNLLALALLDHREPRPLSREVWVACLLMLRFVAMPILMLLGLMLGLVLVEAVLGVNTRLFHDLIAGAIEGTGLISQVAWTVLYTALSYGIANAGFKLITRLPLEAFALISARSGLFTEDSHGGSGVFSRIPGMGTGRAARSLTPSGGTMNRGP